MNENLFPRYFHLCGNIPLAPIIIPLATADETTKGVVMTTDEHSTNEDIQAIGEEYDELASTGILDRSVIQQRLAESEQTQDDAATIETAADDDIPPTEIDEDPQPEPQTATEVDALSDDEGDEEEIAQEQESDEEPESPSEPEAAVDPEATQMYDWTEDVQTIAHTPQPSQVPSPRSSLLSLPSLDDEDDEDGEVYVEDDYEDDSGLTEEEQSESLDNNEGTETVPEAEAGSIEVPEDKPGLFAKGGKGRHALKVVGIVSGSLLAIYGIGGLFFTSHFLPNTRVNGEDVSWMSVDDLSSHVTEVGNAYTGHVLGDGIDLTIAASDINLSYDGGAYGAEAASQISPWTWPAQIFGSHDYRASTGITFDQDKLNAIVLAAVDGINASAQPPTNAAMAFDEATQSFVATPDALGTSIDPATTLATVSDGVVTLQDTIELGDKDLTQPMVHIDDAPLAAVIERANALVRSSIPLRIADRDAGVIDANLMKGWLSTNENCELIVNVDAVKEWAQGDLSKQFDTAGTERKYKRPDGKDVTVTGGDYGWNLDGEALANIIAENLRNDNTASIDVPMKSTAAQWNPGGPDWGNRYIDVDMTEQTVRVYDENSQIVLETPCVTGVPYHATDEGVYSIFEHTPNMVLVGLDYDGNGQPDYETPVSYWMPFNGGQGLHDAYWRWGFGGDIWQYDGSHGCVNLPTDAAAQLFEWSHVGDVVVVHW